MAFSKLLSTVSEGESRAADTSRCGSDACRSVSSTRQLPLLSSLRTLSAQARYSPGLPKCSSFLRSGKQRVPCCGRSVYGYHGLWSFHKDDTMLPTSKFNTIRSYKRSGTDQPVCRLLALHYTARQWVMQPAPFTIGFHVELPM